MNLAFNATDEGVGLYLGAVDREGVSQPCLVPAFYFFDGVFDGLAVAAPALLFFFCHDGWQVASDYTFGLVD